MRDDQLGNAVAAGARAAGAFDAQHVELALDICEGEIAGLPSILLQDGQPPTLIFAQVEGSHGLGFGRLPVRRLNCPEMVPARAHKADAPALESGGGGLSLR
jgi:hypothetical protein